ncbi:MAG: hypothetical protein NTY22_03020 [Proteobacteria bacterium]|nr:hypothetical protein [Pseudomonadota bacterium]
MRNSLVIITFCLFNLNLFAQENTKTQQPTKQYIKVLVQITCECNNNPIVFENVTMNSIEEGYSRFEVKASSYAKCVYNDEKKFVPYVSDNDEDFTKLTFGMLPTKDQVNTSLINCAFDDRYIATTKQNDFARRVVSITINNGAGQIKDSNWDKSKNDTYAVNLEKCKIEYAEALRYTFPAFRY